MDYSQYCYELECAFHDYRYKPHTRAVTYNFSRLLNQYRNFNQEIQAKIFDDMRLGLSDAFIVEAVSLRTHKIFRLEDLVTFWDFLIRNGFNPFQSFVRRKIRKDDETVNPLDVIVSYDVNCKKDYGFYTLVKTIYEIYGNKIFYIECYDTFLIKCCGWMIPHINCLRTFVEILENVSTLENRIRFGAYINWTTFNSSHCLHLLIGMIEEQYYIDLFKRLVLLGADANHSTEEGWNVVSYCPASDTGVLEFLFEHGFKPSNVFIPWFVSRTIAEEDEKKPWYERNWSNLDLTPQMYLVWKFAVGSRNDTELQADDIIKTLQLYEKYAPEFVDYEYQCKTGHRMIDFAEYSGNQKLIDFITTCSVNRFIRSVVI